MDNHAGQQLPITTVIPTWNEIAKIERHISNLSRWLGYVNEVIVVDSHSTDGTLEYIQTHLKHPNLRIEKRPRGLYAAWNHAVTLASSKYINFATAGDRMSKETLFTLYENAEKFNAEIVISPPTFYNSSGSFIQKQWPVHRYIAHHHILNPHIIPPQRCLSWNLMYFPRTMIGSSASNLYLAQTLRAVPFPENFGYIGDSVFAIQHACTSRWLIVPDGDTDFIFHEKTGRDSSRVRAGYYYCAKKLLNESDINILSPELRNKMNHLLTLKRNIHLKRKHIRKLKEGRHKALGRKTRELRKRKNDMIREINQIRRCLQ